MNRNQSIIRRALPALGLFLLLMTFYVAVAWQEATNASTDAVTGPSPTPAASLSPIPTPSPTCIGVDRYWSHFSNPEPIEPADRISNDPGSEPGLPTNYPSIIDVAGVDVPQTCIIGAIAIDFAISSERPDDLDILVVDPQGRKSLVISDAGGNSQLNWNGYLFGIGGSLFPDESAPPVGYYSGANYAGLPGLEPEGIDNFPNAGGLAQYTVNFGNLVPGGWINPGDWKLYVVDDETGNLSSLPQGWRVSFYKMCSQPGGCASPFPTPPTPTPSPTPTPTPTPPFPCIGQTFLPSAGLPAPIPDNAPAGVNVTIPVSGLTAYLHHVSLRNWTWNPAHTAGGDIVMTLQAPANGPTATIVQRRGQTTCGTGSGSLDDLAGPYGFADAFPTNFHLDGPANPVPAGDYFASRCQVGGTPGEQVFLNTVFAGPANPVQEEGPGLEALVGLSPETANGNWTLNISDHAAGDTGTVTAVNLCLVTSGIPPPTPTPPTATAASNITSNSFTANWSSSAGATGYRLDVSPDNTFVTFVPGFNNLDVGNVTSRSVIGLFGGLPYFYRVRAYNGAGTSSNSNMITVVTHPACEYFISPTQANFSANAGTGSVGVAAPFQCSWSAVVNNLGPREGGLGGDLASATGTATAANLDLTEGTPTNWLTITSGGSGIGNGIVNYAVAANTTGFPRTKTMTIAGLTFTVNQSNTSPTRKRFDYDGDGRTDHSVFRPANGVWYLQESTAGFQGVQFGIAEDKLAPADYDGDGKADIAVFRPSAGQWYVLNSATGTVSYPVFGVAEDLPAPGDYDGDGKADWTVFRPSQGTWYRTNSSNGTTFGMQFGQNGDVPTVGDFDGDGKNDLGIFRPSVGDWYNIRSSNGSVFGERFGQTGDRIAPADYDGDGKTDIAIYRPSTGLWVIRNSATATYSYEVFGAPADIPIAGDYDGDGRADIGVWRPSDGTWYIKRSDNSQFIVFPWGQNGDKPTPSAYGN